jgi:hypothetical protein
MNTLLHSKRKKHVTRHTWRTYIVSSVPEIAVAVRVNAQVLRTIFHDDAVVVVVAEQRAPTLVRVR